LADFRQTPQETEKIIIVTETYQPQPPPQPEPKKENWIRRHIKLAILLVIPGIAACGSIVSAIGGEDPATTTAQPTPSPTCDLGGCEGTPAAPPATKPELTPESTCKPLKKSQLSDIASGVEASSSARVKSGVWVPLSGEYQFGFNQVVALRLSTGAVATFATENLGKSDHGLLIAVNRPARNHFTWGAAVNPGTPIDNDLQAVKNSSEYAEAVDCARGQA
jgi:hypothetical protein